jgi:succinyl-diaminopimelate desuccinylase
MHVSRICSDLVRIRSENPPGRTDEAVEYIRVFLEQLGIKSTVTGNAEGMNNLVTRDTPFRLLMCGHVDVVPALDAGWTYPPFSGRMDDHFVHGRGATDMKGGCASILAACEAWVNRGNEIPAMLAFVCDEETGGVNGIQRLLADGLPGPMDCLIAEPSPLRNPSIGQKGLCRMAIEFFGTPAHGSLYPAVGVSAIMEAMEFLEYVKGFHDREFIVDAHLQEIISRSSVILEQEFHLADVSEVLRKLTFNPGVITGGEKSNVVAQRCYLELELRIPWGCTIADLADDIAAHVRTGRVVSQETHEPSMTNSDTRLVRVTCEEIQRVHGGEVFPIVQWAASDARHLRRLGFNVLEYGPGEISTLHAVNERVTIDSLEKAASVYEGVMARYASVSEKA